MPLSTSPVEMGSRRLLKSSMSVLALRILGAALQLLLLALGVIFFPIDDVGRNGMLWTCAVLARVGGTLGLDLYTLREMPEVWRKKELRTFYERCRGMTRSLGVVMLVASTLICLGFLMLAMHNLFDWKLAFCIPVVLLSSSMQRLFSCQIRARGQIVASQAFDALVIPATAIVMLLLALLWEPDFFIYGQVAAIVASTLMTRILWRCPEKNLTSKWLTRHEWRTILPLGMGSALSVASSRAPLLFVGAGSISQAAIYDVGQRIHSSATLASTSASAVLLPRVKTLLVAGDRPLFIKQLGITSATGLIPAVVILCALLLLGPDRMGEVLGPEYNQAWPVSVVLVVSACVTALAGLCHGVLAMAGRTRAFASIALIQLIAVITYGLFFSRGDAISMATFVAVVEIVRATVLVAMMVILSRQLLPASNIN